MMEVEGRGEVVGVALLALVAVVALIERARLNRTPLRIERDAVVYDRTRLPRVDLAIDRAVWLGAHGRVGTALVLRSGAHRLVVGARGGSTPAGARTAIEEPDVVVDAEALDRIAAALGGEATSMDTTPSPTYRAGVPLRAPEAERRVWLSPLATSTGALVQLVFYSWLFPMVANFGPAALFIAAGAVALLIDPVVAKRRHRLRWLRFAGDTLTLEGPDEHVWTMDLARCRRRLEEHRGVVTLELRAQFEDPLRIGTQPATHWAGEGRRVLVAPEDFAWLLARLGLEAPRPLPKTRVAEPRVYADERARYETPKRRRAE